MKDENVGGAERSLETVCFHIQKQTVSGDPSCWNWGEKTKVRLSYNNEISLFGSLKFEIRQNLHFFVNIGTTAVFVGGNTAVAFGGIKKK